MINDGYHDGVPFDAYLAPGTFGPRAVSGSDLVAFETECPAHAYAFWRGNPDRQRSDATPAMTFGSAAHAYLLEGPDAFHARYVVKPDGLSLATREGKAWKETVGAREMVSFGDHMRILDMQAALMRNPAAAKLLRAGGVAEATMIATDPETGLRLLTRPDLYIGKLGLSVNLKTTQSPHPEAWRRTCANLRYDLSDALFRRVARLLGIENASHAFLVVGSKPPHLNYVAALSAEAAFAADAQLDQILRRFAICIDSGHWPSYADGVVEIGLPSWAAAKIQQSITEGDAA
jgi:hypothetical protein